jgi:nucleoside-diphosphate-sugar epimerase
MSLHVIVGAGPVGSATAQRLAAAGHDVRIVSRRGLGPADPRIECVAADATGPGALAPLAVGAAALYNCANPPYHRWPTDWPPIAAALLDAAERSGAVLVTTSNLYGYGPVDHAMRETDPLAATGTKGRVRVSMWQDALAAHDAGRVRATEARASDFFGPGLTDTSHLGRAIPRLAAGKTVRVVGDPDVAHSWTYVPDVARTLVALATDERAWGRPWHVPSAPPCTQRELLHAFTDANGLVAPKVAAYPAWVLRAAGLVWPLMREMHEVMYQFERPFVIDSSACTSTFGIEATPLDEALRATGCAELPEARAAA